MSVKLKSIELEGISGPDKICTLHPYTVLEIIGKKPQEPDQPQEPNTPPVDSNLPNIPSELTKESLIDWMVEVLLYIKKNKL